MTVGLVAQRGESALIEEARDGGGASGVAVTAGALSRRAKANARPKICETGRRAGSAADSCEECSGSKAYCRLWAFGGADSGGYIWL